MNEYSARHYQSFAAMDVHARSIAIATLDTSTGEVASTTLRGCPGAAEVMEWVGAHTTGRVLYAYESGPTKYSLCRSIRDLGGDCGIVAVATLPRSVRQEQRKTDPGDARALLMLISAPAHDFSWCYVPSREEEQARDLCRAYRLSADELARAKQRVSSFLLGKDIVWNDHTEAGNLRSTWTKRYVTWLNGKAAGLGGADTLTLSLYRQDVEDWRAKVDERRRLVLALCQEDRWKPYVDSISQLTSIGPETALLAAAELGDFRRFRSGRRVRSWMGLTPKEHSSGEKGSRGPITKSGPSCLRKCLVEGLGTFPRRKSAVKRTREGQEPVPGTRAEAAKANARLMRRYRALEDGGKSGNKIKVALASELAVWIWHIGVIVAESLE